MTGLFYGGGVDQLWIQFYGTVVVALAVLAVSLLLMYAVKATGALRVSRAGELEGLDLHEHGAPAYPEFVTIRQPRLVPTAQAEAPEPPAIAAAR